MSVPSFIMMNNEEECDGQQSSRVLDPRNEAGVN